MYVTESVMAQIGFDEGFVDGVVFELGRELGRSRKVRSP